MVDLEKQDNSENMCVDSNGRRPGFPSIKFRLREERKKVIHITSAKYHSIEDHETGMRRFCLLRNTLNRLQRDAREEKLARYNARANNVSPSYLSASRPRSPSPPCDMEVADVLSFYGQPTPSPITALSDDEDDLPPRKRPRFFMNNDKENQKENSHEDRLIDVVGDKDESRTMDDTQEILREVYENYTGESLSSYLPSSTTQSNTPYSTLCCSTSIQCSDISSSDESTSPTDLSYNRSIDNSSYYDNCSYSNISGRMEWSKTNHQQYPCSQSALMGNDLQSVVYHSLLTSL